MSAYHFFDKISDVSMGRSRFICSRTSNYNEIVQQTNDKTPTKWLFSFFHVEFSFNVLPWFLLERTIPQENEGVSTLIDL